MMYNELVEHCFFSPEHVGTVDKSEPLTVYYRSGEAGRGDVFDFYLQCNEQGLILKARFKAYGNPYLVAAAELVCKQLEGNNIDEHPQFDYSWLVEQLEIPRTRYPVALQIDDGYREIVKTMKEKLKGSE
ncbi:iron-sulfur cluster assembly scaffold protein [Legionella hackeliae]|uniref:Putative iron-sulpher cluster proteins NifU n=1 Tax=Legionella hackeliae TaxID=449 RepID=A0A0A8UVW5_LEGHA|nr:iron-sulfur cluster assembly scaffold protein [Legionella hackeliae]KTD15409.1 putative iron-sulpher cluster proteins NifU [Legionella hackeliae]CEK11222.1 putative iron-sulpher cluster proteins NifU [Legionella hackeliae]STX47987.1 iron-sulfer cluster proteins NifU [Legionella hackeliae]